MTEPVTPQRLTSGVPEFVRRDHSWCRHPTEPRCWEHASAMNLSPAEAATVARFDAAPDAEESLRERVAATVRTHCRLFGGVGWLEVCACSWVGDDHAAHVADAAIAVMRGDDA